MSEQPKVPKFRVPAAFVSPAALCLIAGTIWFFAMDRTSEEDVEATVQKEFPHVSGVSLPLVLLFVCIKLHVIAQSGPAVLLIVIIFYSRAFCVLFFLCTQSRNLPLSR